MTVLPTNAPATDAATDAQNLMLPMFEELDRLTAGTGGNDVRMHDDEGGTVYALISYPGEVYPMWSARVDTVDERGRWLGDVIRYENADEFEAKAGVRVLLVNEDVAITWESWAAVIAVNMTEMALELEYRQIVSRAA